MRLKFETNRKLKLWNIHVVGMKHQFDGISQMHLVVKNKKRVESQYDIK